MAPWICSKESVGKFCRIVSAAAPIPILVDNGCQRDTAPRHVIAAIAHFNVFVLHQDRFPYFRDGARITLHCAAANVAQALLLAGTPADARCLGPAEASS